MKLFELCEKITWKKNWYHTAKKEKTWKRSVGCDCRVHCQLCPFNTEAP